MYIQCSMKSKLTPAISLYTFPSLKKKRTIYLRLKFRYLDYSSDQRHSHNKSQEGAMELTPKNKIIKLLPTNAKNMPRSLHL